MFPTIHGIVSQFGVSYIDKVNSYNPIVYFPMNETSGSTMIDQVNSPDQDGAYTGVSLNNSTGPDGEPVGLWDGANDYGDIYSPTLAGVFNGAELAVAGWARVFDINVWTDGNAHTFVILRVNVTNVIEIEKATTNNRIRFNRNGGGTLEQHNEDGLSLTSWMHIAIEVSETGDYVKYYLNGSLLSTDTVLGAWTGSLNSGRTLIGANAKTPIEVWNGWFAHWAIFPVLGDAAILDLADPTG